MVNPKLERKKEYAANLRQLLTDYDKLFLVTVDNVGSKQMQEIRKALRGTATILMGKNTMIRRVIREMIADQPRLERLLPLMVGNTGFVFTNDELSKVRTMILDNKVPAAAKAGAIAPIKVVLPAGQTNLEPTQTSFLQALSIPSKINKGKVEILKDINLLEVGQKVGGSEAALLAKLDIKPFSYGLKVTYVFDSGSVYDPVFLDMTDEDVNRMVQNAAQNIASVSLAIGFPTAASVPHSLVNAFRNLIAVSIESDYTFPQSEMVKEYLKDPSKFASAAPAAAAAPAAEEAKQEEEEEESDDDMGMGLFD